MKNLTKKALTLLLAVMLVMSVCAQALADDEYDTNTGFRVADDSDITNDSDTEFFYLAKNYLSGNNPAETLTYRITPLAVWNAGRMDVSSGSATASFAAIDNTNMPMLEKDTNGGGVTYDDTTTARTLRISQTVAAGLTSSAKVKVNLPDYDTVGDYWYQVVEDIGNSTGVFYGINDSVSATNTTTSNGGHTSHTYYIHVQVIDDGTPDLLRSVAMHKTAPVDGNGVLYADDAAYNENYGYFQKTVSGNTVYGNYANTNTNSTSDKVNSIQNDYYAGTLSIIKAVNGNAGDKTKYFPVTVVFTKPSGTIVNSDISFTAPMPDTTTNGYTSTDVTIKGQYYNETAPANTLKWSNTSTAEATASVTFYVKDGTTVTFTNIPYGVNYSVTEGLTASEGYENKLEFTSSSKDPASPAFDGQGLVSDSDDASKTFSTVASKAAVGSISDASDEVTITNQKNLPIDVGVITENAPYVALVAVAAAGIILLAIRRKKAVED